MRIHQALTADRVSVHLAESDCWSALRALARSFAQSDSRLNASELHAAFEARVRLGNTHLGDGCAAVPVRVPGLGQPQLAVSVVREPFEYAQDAGRVRILIGLLSDAAHPRAHLARMHELTRLLRDAGVRERLRAASDAAEVLSVLASAAAGAQRYALAS